MAQDLTRVKPRGSIRTMSPKTAVAKLRKSGLSQRKIAAACGCTEGAISRIGSGNRINPTYSIARKLVAMAQALPR